MNLVSGTAKDAHRAYKESQAALAADYLERARAISALVERDAGATESAAMITKAVHDAYAANNLYWMALPKELGGAGLGGRAVLGVIEEIARADGSSGWSLMANACNNALASAYMPDAGADQMYGGKNKGITCGQFSAAGKAVEVDGGLKGGGHYRFGSGCGHASWIGGGVTVYENGKPRMLSNGLPDMRVIHVPMEKAKLCGNWDVIGLVGTASFDYEIPEQFVSKDFVFSGSPTETPVRGGPFCHVGWFGFGSVGHSGVVLGITKRALEEVVAIVHGKARLGYNVPVHQHPVFKHQFAVHEASYWAGRHLIMDAIDVCETAALAGEALTSFHFSRLRQACSWIHKAAVEIVGFCHHWGASQSFRLPTALGRCSQDMLVATQHVIADEAAWSDNAGPIYDAWLERNKPL